ncbi:right-handed parallel beta-helix repeat-containing protein [Chengkuizengella axinellae]|uniref:Right-handed parallel beta-helix repeat-containing protein n=1 Tax=Chengkuizengella axinellae TaxID=3064388 RepID=A0ABT9IXH7_9BACL|nr:right-handed parallel beta-helix repeat-containing protein [Chengkuizengella sp. 2205SS18-9]MDP5274076.1 right-handed parallel beta-helix repeat-containing protein [Chengkuizengella sp. 2205SS18-9]
MTVRKVPTTEFPTINEALAVSQPYDTIRVGEGTFAESLSINVEGLRLIGEGKGKTTIDGRDLGLTDGIIIDDNCVTIQDLTVQNFKGSGICVVGFTNIIHKVQILNNGSHGIEINTSLNIVIECVINDNIENGIVVERDDNYIIQCKIIHNLNGVFLNDDNNLIYCCIAQKNRQDGFNVSSCRNYIISCAAINNNGNGFNDNNEDSNFYTLNKALGNLENGFVIGNFTVLFENISKENGLNGMIGADDARIIKNLVMGNKENGIRIEGKDSLIDRNIVTNNTVAGISIAGNNIAVRSNCIKGNSPDLFVEIEIVGCTFADNTCETSMPFGLCERNDAIDVQEGESIQQAISDAQDGFQINVSKGIFHEQIMIPINKDRLRIVGSDACETILDGKNIAGNGMTIESERNSIENITVQHFGSSGVLINNEENTFDKVQSKNNQADGFQINNNQNLFNLCEAKMNGNNGFHLQVDSELNYFLKCNTNHNGGNGFLEDEISNEHLFFCNTSKQNGMDGFRLLSDPNLCIGNWASNNKGNGFFINEDSLILNNKTIDNSLNGLFIEEDETLIWGNVCNKNKADGIQINELENRIIKNICQLNNGNGIQINDTFFIESIIDHNCIENNLKSGIIIVDPTADNFGIRSNCLSGNSPDIQNNSESTDNIVFDENKCNSSIPGGLCEGDCRKKKYFKR